MDTATILRRLNHLSEHMRYDMADRDYTRLIEEHAALERAIDIIKTLETAKKLDMQIKR